MIRKKFPFALNTIWSQPAYSASLVEMLMQIGCGLFHETDTLIESCVAMLADGYLGWLGESDRVTWGVIISIVIASYQQMALCLFLDEFLKKKVLRSFSYISTIMQLSSKNSVNLISSWKLNSWYMNRRWLVPRRHFLLHGQKTNFRSASFLSEIVCTHASHSGAGVESYVDKLMSWMNNVAIWCGLNFQLFKNYPTPASASRAHKIHLKYVERHNWWMSLQ